MASVDREPNAVRRRRTPAERRPDPADGVMPVYGCADDRVAVVPLDGELV